MSFVPHDFCCTVDSRETGVVVDADVQFGLVSVAMFNQLEQLAPGDEVKIFEDRVFNEDELYHIALLRNQFGQVIQVFINDPRFADHG